MIRLVSVIGALLLLLAGSMASAAAQEMDVSFSDVKLRELGYPEINITVGPDGVDAPSEVAAGYYLVTLHPTEEFSAYVDFMVPPADLSEEEATELALQAARNDLAQPGWIYAGGTNTFEVGVPVSFAIYLAPGEYMVAASYYAMEQGSEEIMTLVPLTVTGGEATPVAGTPAATPVTAQASPAAQAQAPRSDVTLIMTDSLRFIVSPDPVPAGPQLWEVRNTGAEQSHHLVMMRVPDGTTADDMLAEFSGMMAGTPAAGESVMAQATYVGYAALQSGGQTTWQEFDLEPGTYAILCFIIDPATGEPHLINGMVTTFVVE